MTDFVERYLLLGLRLGKHIDGLVDAYYGPEELAREVDAEEPADPAALADEAVGLNAAVAGAGLDEQRTRYLLAQLRGCETTARRLAGEPISWADEVERCYGVRPELTDEDVYAAAQEELDRALPGNGDLAGRYRAWLDTQVVPPERVLDAARSIERELHERTARMFGLPDGEQVELDVVSNEPWSGFNYYLGGLRSRVVINTDLPVQSVSLAHLVAHEIYPGHHTEHSWKEQLIARERGRLEETIFLTGTPQAVVSEGLAMLAPEIALGEDEDAVVAPALAALEVPYEADVAPAVRRFTDAVESIAVNLGYKLHEEGRPHDELVEYAMRWSLRSRERVEKGIEFLTHPTWRAYASCYTAGLALCRQFVDGDPRKFERLLKEQLTPADLAA